MTIKSYEAAERMPASRFAKYSGENTTTTTSSSKDNIIGITDTKEAAKGNMSDILMQGEIGFIEAGGTFSAGDALTSDENGCAIKAGLGDNIGAIALQDAVQKDIVSVIVTINRTVSDETQETEQDTDSKDEGEQE